MWFVFSVSDAEKEADSSDDPLGLLLLGLEVEGPHKRGASDPRLVHRALVDVLGLLLVDRDGSDEDDGHAGREVLQLGLLDEPSLRVPASALHEQPVDVGPLSGWAAEILPVLLGDVALEAHLVQRPLVLAGHGLHDGGEERLWVEEPSQPDAGRHVEVAHPVLQVADAEEEVYVPDGEPTEGGVGSLGPGVGDLVQEEGVLETLHVSRDGQLSLWGRHSETTLTLLL